MQPEELDPVDPSGWMGAVRRRQAARLQVLAQDCPRCENPRGPMAKACMPAIQYGDDCRHGAWKRNLDAVQERVARFRRYKLGRGDWEPLVTESEAPPAPPDAMMGSKTDREAHANARSVVGRFTATKGPQVIVLSGRTGTGKSLLAAWAACRFESSLMAAASRANAFASWDPIIASVQDVTCLVIDDLGQERPSESNFASRAVATLLCERINVGQRIIVTTNLALGELIDRYDPLTEGRLRGRLVESGEFVTTGNADLRIAMKAAGR